MADREICVIPNFSHPAQPGILERCEFLGVRPGVCILSILPRREVAAERLLFSKSLLSTSYSRPARARWRALPNTRSRCRVATNTLRCEKVGKKSASKAGSFQSSGPDPKKTRTWRSRFGTQVRRNRDPTMHFLRRPLERHTHGVLRRAGQSALLARKPWIYTDSSGRSPTFRTLGFLLRYCSLEIRT